MKITDHAKIRFIERVLGIDLEAIFVRELLDEAVAESIKTLGDGIYPSKDATYRLIVRDKHIISILAPGMKANFKKRKKRKKSKCT